MLELYGMASPNVTKVSLLLEELALPFAFRWVDVFAEEQFTPEFTRLNPNHKVPVLVDHRDPEPQVLFESTAILIYLAERAGRFLPAAGDPQRYEVLKWLMIQATGFGPMCGQYVHFSRYAPTTIDYALDRYRNEVMRLYRLLDRRLGESACIGGEEWSIADMAMFPWAALHDSQHLPWDGLPNLVRWFEEGARRPAVVRTMAALEAVMAQTHAASARATPQAMARFLNREAG